MRIANTYLNHDSEHCCIECAEHQAVHGQRDCGNRTEFLEAAYTAVNSDEEHSNLKRVVPKDGVADPIERLKHDIAGRLQTAVFLRLERLRVREDRARKAERLLEANRTHQERERLGHRDRVKRDVEIPAERKGEQEPRHRGKEDTRR